MQERKGYPALPVYFCLYIAEMAKEMQEHIGEMGNDAEFCHGTLRKGSTPERDKNGSASGFFQHSH
jgi:hypothetical protein